MAERAQRVVIIDIDGLRRDVFEQAVRSGAAPALARLLGGAQFARGVSVPAFSVMPSVTFACQASLFTGAWPRAHRVTGNQVFDRLGVISGGKPRHFGFDVGDTLAYDDAVAVFTDGLAGRLLSADTPTVYERAARHGLHTTVVHHMYARGAETWLRPRLVDLARFTKGGPLFGMEGPAFDAQMVAQTLAHLDAGARPDILTVYFMGLDHESHAHGPEAQAAYLAHEVDQQIGQICAALERHGLWEGTVFAIVSDHGQIGVHADDAHSLRIGFPFDREMGALFDALGLDVFDYPGEDPACSAVCATNGGSAHVYLHHGWATRDGRAGWAEPPRFAEDVLPVARAFNAAHARGELAPELRGALGLVLVRDAQVGGWHAPYRVLRTDGTLVDLQEELLVRPDLAAVDAGARLAGLACAQSGDILLIANYAEGYYFGRPNEGTHGGLHAEDSSAVLAFGVPAAGAAEAGAWIARIEQVVSARCAAEGGRRPSLVELVPCVGALLGWEDA